MTFSYFGYRSNMKSGRLLTENENDLFFLYVRRVRNNPLQGGKFNGRFFDPEQSRELLEHSITILMVAIFMSSPMLEAYENRID